MLKRTFLENLLIVFAVLCAIISTSSGCGKVGTTGTKLAGTPKPKAGQVQSYNLTNPTWQQTQKPQPLIPPFEMPVTGQGSPTFLSAQQPQPLIRSFEFPVAGQGTPRPAANPRTPRNDKDQGDWVSEVIEDVARDVVDVVLDSMREDRRRNNQQFNPSPPQFGGLQYSPFNPVVIRAQDNTDAQWQMLFPDPLRKVEEE